VVDGLSLTRYGPEEELQPAAVVPCVRLDQGQSKSSPTCAHYCAVASSVPSGVLLIMLVLVLERIR